MINQLRVATKAKHMAGSAMDSIIDDVASGVHALGNKTMTVTIKVSIQAMGTTHEIKATPSINITEKTTGDTLSDIFDPDQPDMFENEEAK